LARIRNPWPALLCFALCGCELVADFDRGNIVEPALGQSDASAAATVQEASAGSTGVAALDAGAPDAAPPLTMDAAIVPMIDAAAASAPSPRMDAAMDGAMSADSDAGDGVDAAVE
jgi:hypothetical protein